MEITCSNLQLERQRELIAVLTTPVGLVEWHQVPNGNACTFVFHSQPSYKSNFQSYEFKQKQK